MGHYWKNVLAIVIVIVLSFACLSVSTHLMTGLEDCPDFGRISDTDSDPPRQLNCASDNRLMWRDAFQLAAVGLFLVPIFWLAIYYWRLNTSGEQGLEKELGKRD